MPEINEYAPGTFCWTDMGTTDVEGAKGFYVELFGWDFDDMPAGEVGTYTMFNLRGKEVAAIYEMYPEQRAQSVPPNWLSYLSVEDADNAAERVEANGGTLMSKPFEVMESGRMAVAQDPTGAVFALWQPRAHRGAQLVNEPGWLSWNELATKDADVASRFYEQVVGWKTHVHSTEPTPYTLFMKEEGRPVGGMLEMTDEWGGIPSHWMVYFAVGDCDQSAQKASGLGGTVNVPPTDTPSGRFALIQDPQGAIFTIIKLAPPS